MKGSITCFLMVMLAACGHDEGNNVNLPSSVYQYVKIDSSWLANKHSVYAPVYSHIYMENGKITMNLTATLSIRNTSFTDSFYVTDVTYYGSQGELLKRYLDSTVLVKPMASIEFVVEREESKGGAGANFVVKWGASKTISEPLIQTLMNETGAGISFVTNGVEMK